MRNRRITALLAAGLLFLNGGAQCLPASAESSTVSDDGIPEESGNSSGKISYAEYLAAAGYAAAKESISLPAAQASADTGTPEKADGYEGCTDPVWIMNDSDSIIWNFTIPADGLYAVDIRYISATSGSGNLEQVMLIDGEVPFKEGGYVSYKRTFRNITNIRSDLNGNDLKPFTEEIRQWATQEVSDPSGYIGKPLTYALSKGEHTLTLQGQSGSVAVAAVNLHPAKELPSYAQVKDSYDKMGYQPADTSDPVIREGEDVLYKSDVTIYPVNDRTSPDTYPQDAAKVRLNTIGGDKWKQAGQWITWEVEVPTDGLYQITPRFKQSLADGIYVSRRLRIDGKVPFAEAESLKFAYKSGWQCRPLGDENGAYWFYLTAGEPHTITMEVCLGQVGEYLGEVEDSLNRLNAVYRDILMITGSVPDTDRDYGFDRLIPKDIQVLHEEYERLSRVVDAIVAEAGRGTYVSMLNKLVFQLGNMAEKPRSIAKNLDQFKSNLGSLGTWLLTARQQPLQFDRLYIQPAGAEAPKADRNILSRFWFGVQCFVSSFFNDYNNIGQSAEIDTGREITVWIQTGRDQAQILRQLIDDHFSSAHGIKVNLQLVAGGSLLPSVLAGIGPDVALNNGVGDPINYAIRNANVELTQFPDFQEVADRFFESALEPYTFMGKTYALPETMTFPMFFYRTDIFEELGLKVPETWDEMMALIPVLQRHNMSMAYPKDQTGYSIILYQNGGSLYENNGERSGLTTDVALESFQEFTELFTLYRLPAEYDFPNRFRTGEMPCGIQDYTLYNNLVAFAPEIKGLWEFVPVPGKAGPDGQVRHVSVSGGTNVMMLRDCADREAAWEFMKWWTDTEAQSLFGIEMESALGAAAKQPTANREALLKMSWTSKESRNIINQLSSVRAVPEVPGSYFTTRVIDFAFNRVYNTLENPVEVIEDYMDELNEELARKRTEFGL